MMENDSNVDYLDYGTTTAYRNSSVNFDANASIAYRNDVIAWMRNQTYSFRVGGACVAILGVVGNTLAIVVLQRKRMWCSTAYFLIILAIYDNIILLIAMFRFFVSLSDEEHEYLRSIQFVLFIPVSYFAQSGTIFMTLVVTVERYVAVSIPLKARIIFSLSSAKKISLGILIWCALYNCPHCFALNLSHPTYTNFTRTRSYPFSTFGLSYFYKKVYSIYIQMLTMYLIPWLAMVIFNILLLRSVRKIKIVRPYRHSRSSFDNGRRLTLPVIAITTVFFLAYPFPAFEDTFCKQFGTLSAKRYSICETKKQVLFMLVSEIARVLNSAANFVFYCVLGRKFRRTFLHLAGTWRRKMSSMAMKSSVPEFRQGTMTN